MVVPPALLKKSLAIVPSSTATTGVFLGARMSSASCSRPPVRESCLDGRGVGEGWNGGGAESFNPGSLIPHPKSLIRHPSSAIRHPPSAIRHPPSEIVDRGSRIADV